jgi:hypothetical protein
VKSAIREDVENVVSNVNSQESQKIIHFQPNVKITLKIGMTFELKNVREYS